MSEDFLDTVEIEGIGHPICEDENEYDGLLLTDKDIRAIQADFGNGNEVWMKDTHGQVVGRVTNVRKDYLGRLIAVLEMSAKKHPELVRKLQNGEYQGLSLGLKHFMNPDTMEIERKKLLEVSICPEGDLPGTSIRTVRRERRKDIADTHAALDDRLGRDRRPLPILTTASKEGGGKAYVTTPMEFRVRKGLFSVFFYLGLRNVKDKYGREY